ncbi:MAG: SRPBCC family protein [Candidatus Dormibacteraeota bacterium]|nr:SRPBCC family protein [Candidatus Dormibacteraeota bacterium]
MRFQVTVPVAAPASRLWAVVTDPLAWPELTESMDRVTWERGDSVAVGSRARVAQPRLGENLWEVTEVTPGRRFAWRNSRPGVTTVGTHEVREAGPDASELVLGIDESGPLVPLVDLLVGGRSRHYVELEAAGLKRGAEAHATAPPRG